MKILTVDDDEIARNVLFRALTGLGHKTVVTASASEALAEIEREYCPVLIADWVMPGMDGLELCRAVRRRVDPQYTYIVLLTVRASKEDYLQAMAAGADDFISKPFEILHLAARLRVAERILALQGRVQTLEGLLPICSYCKQIREGTDTWVPIEAYISERTRASFSHGLCPPCRAQHVEPVLRAQAGRHGGAT